MAAAGRPSKLTPVVQKSITEAVAKGLPLKHAARCAGVSESTLRGWSARGKAETVGPFLAFLTALKAAQADAVAGYVAVIRRAAFERDDVTVKETVYPDGTVERVTTTRRVFDWHAAAWWLERQHPDEFSSDRRELRELRKLVNQLTAERAAADVGNKGALEAGAGRLELVEEIVTKRLDAPK